MKLFFLVILFLIFLGLGIWWFGWFDFVEKTNNISLNFNSQLDFEGLRGETVKNFAKSNVIKGEAASLVNTLAELPKKIISEAVGNFKESLVGSTKDGVGQVIDSFQQNLGLGRAAIVNEKPLLMSLAGAVNQPVNFLIDGINEEGVYAIDWGDGEQVSGKIDGSSRKVISHIWKVSGIYLVNAVISNNNNQIHRFSFPVNIQE